MPLLHIKLHAHETYVELPQMIKTQPVRLKNVIITHDAATSTAPHMLGYEIDFGQFLSNQSEITSNLNRGTNGVLYIPYSVNAYYQMQTDIGFHIDSLESRSNNPIRVNRVFSLSDGSVTRVAEDFANTNPLHEINLYFEYDDNSM